MDPKNAQNASNEQDSTADDEQIAGYRLKKERYRLRDEQEARRLRRTNRITLACLGFVGAVVVVCGVQDYLFGLRCEQYIKRATDAEAPAVAVQNLDVAIRYAEANGLTEGNTSLFVAAPENDVGFWYRNLVSARRTVASLTPDTPELTRSNVLMRTREALLDSDHDGPSVTVPTSIAAFPHLRLYVALMALGLVAAAASRIRRPIRS